MNNNRRGQRGEGMEENEGDKAAMAAMMVAEGDLNGATIYNAPCRRR